MPPKDRASGTAGARDGVEYILRRHALADGDVTTLYAVVYPRRSMRVRVVHFPQSERLDVWCRRNDSEEAIVAGHGAGPVLLITRLPYGAVNSLARSTRETEVFETHVARVPGGGQVA